jgi:hypothetical protein
MQVPASTACTGIVHLALAWTVAAALHPNIAGAGDAVAGARSRRLGNTRIFKGTSKNSTMLDKTPG